METGNTMNNTKVKAAKKAKKDERNYPLGGMGLTKQEEKTVEQMLIDAGGLSLKFVQRNFFRQWLAGEIKIKLE